MALTILIAIASPCVSNHDIFAWPLFLSLSLSLSLSLYLSLSISLSLYLSLSLSLSISLFLFCILTRPQSPISRGGVQIYCVDRETLGLGYATSSIIQEGGTKNDKTRIAGGGPKSSSRQDREMRKKPG